MPNAPERVALQLARTAAQTVEERALTELSIQLKEKEARLALREGFVAEKEKRLEGREAEVAASQALLAQLQSNITHTGLVMRIWRDVH